MSIAFIPEIGLTFTWSASASRRRLGMAKSVSNRYTGCPPRNCQKSGSSASLKKYRL
jgi:hypothetical protein